MTKAHGTEKLNLGQKDIEQIHMIRLYKKYRPKVSNRLAAMSAMMLLISSLAGPVGMMPANQSTQLMAESNTEPSQQAENSALDGAVADLASAVGQSGSKALNISSLIFRF